ncbi:LacI family DNA-binding transcriptional regulator [Dictyobacter aurantiacus]|uniref:LacI family transcriptional regulator n=1 Tax=Dictyobacter aurantiacus TaxID=1936993 RepID=A0A401ZLG3_9CHLR|nr:LacI family DNA-binding transcriptional regulator [Dictyobacter aurantiacus]GCE07654.1 LacI family transcriptional regulator [Dictyobacter aurantiacus]
MRQSEVSISDIARIAGVSHTTVSRALRESPLISTKTRERIQRLAGELGYTPNAIARSLQTKQSSTVGLVVTSIADPFFGDIVKGVEEVARASDFSVLLSASYNDPEQTLDIIETFHRRRVDGILVASSRISDNYSRRLHHTHIPTVLINSQVEGQTNLLHWISVDDRRGAQMAVEHLQQLGHRAIGYLGSHSRPASSSQRYQGYLDALRATGVEPSPSWVVIPPGNEASQEEDISAGQQALSRFLAAGVTAVFCYNDMTAIGMLTSCHAKGVRVPQDLSVIGFDDITIASCFTPPLTTIHQPRVELGRLATQVMLDLLQERPGANHTLCPTLVVRASTAPLST